MFILVTHVNTPKIETHLHEKNFVSRHRTQIIEIHFLLSALFSVGEAETQRDVVCCRYRPVINR